MWVELDNITLQRQVDTVRLSIDECLKRLLEESLESYDAPKLFNIFGDDEGENLKERLNTAIQRRDYLIIKQCLIELRNILSELLNPVRLSLILLYLTKLIARSFLSKYKANLEIPPTARQGEKIESFPPHVCIYA